MIKNIIVLVFLAMISISSQAEEKTKIGKIAFKNGSQTSKAQVFLTSSLGIFAAKSCKPQTHQLVATSH